ARAGGRAASDEGRAGPRPARAVPRACRRATLALDDGLPLRLQLCVRAPSVNQGRQGLAIFHHQGTGYRAQGPPFRRLFFSETLAAFANQQAS
ncbi:Hypothetical predicted protein, partial [Olea europaea subsp. europaea]